MLKVASICSLIVAIASCEEEPEVQSLPRGIPMRGVLDCKWGTDDCNRCTEKPYAQIIAMEKNSQHANHLRFDGYAWPISDHLVERIDASYEHIQGIARIPGLGDGEYMLFTHSTNSDQEYVRAALAVVRMGAGRWAKGEAFESMSDMDGPDSTWENRTVAATSTQNNHPGGIATLGKYAYVAQWCQPGGILGKNGWCDEWNPEDRGMGFSVYDLSSIQNFSNELAIPPEEIHYHHAYNEAWLEESSTTAIAAAKLENGQYLVTMSRSGGKKLGFYLSRSPAGPFTFAGSADLNGSVAENSSMIVDCDSGYLQLMHIGPAGGVEAYLLFQDGDKIQPAKLYSRDFSCLARPERGEKQWCNFAAGANFYTTPTGKLLLYSSNKYQSSGNIGLAEFTD